ncbi:hypothetical protein PLANTIT3_60516 [Plantibacter sp. T3]|nr:hypothetical protein PLANTIT3_60516 [Plantibacter sp. T3]
MHAIRRHVVANGRGLYVLRHSSQACRGSAVGQEGAVVMTVPFFVPRRRLDPARHGRCRW